MKQEIKCVHGHTSEEIRFYGCETNPEYHGVTTKHQESYENKIRQICTYYSELGEGTAGYELTEEQFQKIFSVISETLEAERERIEREVRENFNSLIEWADWEDIDEEKTIKNILSLINPLDKVE